MDVTTLGIFVLQAFLGGRIGSKAAPPIHVGIVGFVIALLTFPWVLLLVLLYAKTKQSKMRTPSGNWFLAGITCLLSATPLQLIQDEEKLFPLMILLGLLGMMCTFTLLKLSIAMRRVAGVRE